MVCRRSACDADVAIWQMRNRVDGEDGSRESKNSKISELQLTRAPAAHFWRRIDVFAIFDKLKLSSQRGIEVRRQTISGNGNGSPIRRQSERERIKNQGDSVAGLPTEIGKGIPANYIVDCGVEVEIVGDEAAGGRNDQWRVGWIVSARQREGSGQSSIRGHNGRTLRRLNPKTKIMVSTGRDETCRLPEMEALAVNACLLKPYTREKFLQALAEVFQREGVVAA